MHLWLPGAGVWTEDYLRKVMRETSREMEMWSFLIAVVAIQLQLLVKLIKLHALER